MRTHALHDGGEVGADAVGHVNADGLGSADVADGFGRADDGLGRDAAGVEAVAAEEAFLDQGDLGAEAGGPDYGHESRGAAADDDEVVLAAGRGILPAAGVDVGDQFLVELAPGGFHDDAVAGGVWCVHAVAVCDDASLRPVQVPA